LITTDLAIVGAGVAGLSAAAEAAKQGVQVLVIERMGAGGQVMTVERITNFPGHAEGISGFELGPLLQEQAEEAGAQFLLETVMGIEPVDGGHLVRCEGEDVRARAVLVAAGSVRRKLGVPGEAELEGRGVSHCASCDGPLFQCAAVCVVGGGDSGFGEAAVLAAHARTVTIVFREPRPHAQAALVEAATARPNVRLVPGAEVTAIVGGKDLQGVRVRRADGSEQELPAAGVFVYAGLHADPAFLAGLLERDTEGRIRTDAQRRTSLPGVFAAGDIRSGVPYLLADAASDGIAAASAVVRYLRASAR
jgi:thioredoxin reductase (NADPH)